LPNFDGEIPIKIDWQAFWKEEELEDLINEEFTNVKE
jgi:hypothetical protein